MLYDKTDKYSIEKYAQKLVGKTFNDICKGDLNDTIVIESENTYALAHGNKKRKGGLGEIVEERFFQYKANSDSSPDFKEAGVELKVTPYKINKNKSISAKERLVLTMIDYNSVINEKEFDSSHFWYKSQWLLLVYYLWQKEIKDRLDYRIDYARLFTPSEEDLEVIRNDYFKIIEKIEAGYAHELSESDTMYLSACTNKSSYMTYVLNHYIHGAKPKYESIIKNDNIKDIEAYITDKINKHKGKSVTELCADYDIEFDKIPKNLYAMLAYRMLGITSNNAEEFVKANIKVKTIRIDKNNTIKENMSFPTFDFISITKQDWEESEFYELLSSTKFLFIVYHEREDGLYNFDHAQFWNIPYKTLNGEVKEVWEKTKQIALNPPSVLKQVNGKYKGIFPKKTDNPVCHVRPHGKDSKDTLTLIDGREYPKQCFWLNNSYILSVIENN